MRVKGVTNLYKSITDLWRFGFCWIFQANLNIFQPCVLLVPETQTLQRQWVSLMGPQAEAPSYPAWNSQTNTIMRRHWWRFRSLEPFQFHLVGNFEGKKKRNRQSRVACGSWCGDCVTQSSYDFRNVAASCDQSAPGPNWHSWTVSESGRYGVCVREPGSRPSYQTSFELGRADIIFNEIIAYSERRCTFNAGDLGKCTTNRRDLTRWPLRCLTLCIMHKVGQLWY